MQVKVKACGEYQTNCYIIEEKIIIDPGIGATEWVLENIKFPKAIILTHGHFDHMWSVKELKEILEIPVYIHKEDEFMLQNDIFDIGIPKTTADILIEEDKTILIDNIEVTFKQFGGHTPGSMTIEIGDFMFSGDFIFNGAVGRVDFPYSNKKEMKKSFQKFLKLDYDKIIYTGHGVKTTIKTEQQNIKKYWLNQI
jgi:glyoxylase-like metal-dependent hydrolase (beta-lactamase superfamily II)